MEYGIIIIIVIVVLFLIGRELFCWYSKINERILLQKKTNDLLEKLIQLSGGDNSSNINKFDNIEVAQNDFPEQMNWEDAKKACEALGNGWRLPTKDELKTLYLNKDKISGFVSNNYWSSTESGSNDAWVQNFNSGSQGDSNKNNKNGLRAVRTI